MEKEENATGTDPSSSESSASTSLGKKRYLHDFSPQEVDILINKVLIGTAPKTIADEMMVDIDVIVRLIKSKDFKEKLNKVIAVQRKHVLAPWKKFESQKLELIKQALTLALECEDAKVRAQMTTWCLERFPEFSLKNVPQTGKTGLQRQLSPDEIAKMERTTAKMMNVIDVLKNGNPNVVTVREVKIEQATPPRVEAKKPIPDRLKQFHDLGSDSTEE